MDRYAELHKSFNGPGDARPTAEQIIKDENLTNKLQGKTILITGGNSGLGLETARVLHQTGAKIFITARSADKGEEAVKSINSVSPDFPAVEFVLMELGSLESVRKAADDFLARSDGLNILIENAGIMACPEGKTVDGFETQFGTNHLGHFLLFQKLKEKLLSSSTPECNSRVIVLASTSHRFGDIQPPNYDLAGTYQPWSAYSQSKTANVLFANELDRRYGSKGLHALSLHPGIIMTGIARHIDMGEHTDEKLFKVMKSIPQGAATQVWAAVAGCLEGKGGLYLDDVQVGKEGSVNEEMYVGGWVGHIWNKENAARLWKDSLKFVGLSQEE